MIIANDTDAETEAERMIRENSERLRRLKNGGTS